MILDTETTGIPITLGYRKYYNYTNSDKYDSARLIQLAWIVFDEKHNEVSRNSYIIKPSGFVIPDGLIHNIDNKTALQNGHKLYGVLKKFQIDLDKIDTIIGHNIKFDKYVLLAELYRRNKNKTLGKFKSKIFKCTGILSKDICNIPLGNIIKFPKLIEAYNIIVKKPITCNLHDALNDCILCSEIYHKLIENS
jgi:DNA polymerase III epsilon subunit-like protein